jgi:hypothetical protein
VGGRKSANSRFFLSRSALSLFFALFFLHAFALLFCLRARERESAKKAPAPTAFALASAKKAPAPTYADPCLGGVLLGVPHHIMG